MYVFSNSKGGFLEQRSFTNVSRTLLTGILNIYGQPVSFEVDSLF